jgi:hypothetical protein
MLTTDDLKIGLKLIVKPNPDGEYSSKTVQKIEVVGLTDNAVFIKDITNDSDFDYVTGYLKDDFFTEYDVIEKVK